jgi:putative ABC transport system permease protein
MPAVMQHLFGITGLLAADHLTRRPRRMTATTTVMVISAWSAIVVSSGNFGYRAFVDEWNASQNVWNLTITGAGPSPFRSSVSLPASLVDQLSRRPDIRAIVMERRMTIETPRGDFEIRAIDLDAYSANGAGFLWDHGDEASALARLTDPARPAVLLSSFASFAQNLRPGDTLTLDTPRGPQAFEIAGTILSAIDPLAIGEASLIMDRAVYRRVWHDARVDRLMIKLAPGVDASALRRDLQHDYADGGFAIVEPAQLSASIDAAIFNMSITSQVLSLLLLATVTLGIANTLVIEVLDRRREMGVLRALGLRGRQAAVSLMLEVVLLVIIAGVMALPMALHSNYANTLGMGEVFAIRFVLNPIEVTISLSLILISATAASYFPARQAGQVDVLEALRYE